MRNCDTASAKERKNPYSADSIVSSSGNESEDNENDDTACLECKWLWRLHKERRDEVWLISDICDAYVCPKCSPERLDENNEIYCNSCSTWDI